MSSTKRYIIPFILITLVSYIKLTFAVLQKTLCISLFSLKIRQLAQFNRLVYINCRLKILAYQSPDIVQKKLQSYGKSLKYMKFKNFSFGQKRSGVLHHFVRRSVFLEIQ